MVSVDGTNISLTRGDTLILQIEMYKEGEPYVPMTDDSVRFAMKQKYTDPECLIEKQIPMDTLVLELEPDDTKPLTMGQRYVYDIELTDALGRVDTFISGKIKLTSEVE